MLKEGYAIFLKKYCCSLSTIHVLRLWEFYLGLPDTLKRVLCNTYWPTKYDFIRAGVSTVLWDGIIYFLQCIIYFCKVSCLQLERENMLSLHWRQNGSDGVYITSVSSVYSTVCSGVYQRKHQSSASVLFVRGIYRWPVNSPHKGPLTRKRFPFDDVIMTPCIG